VNFENSTPALDCLVRELSQQPEVYGARLTGGGFGGAVMAFASADFDADAAASVARAYEAQCHRKANVIHTHAGVGARLL
jgi:galactokinase